MCILPFGRLSVRGSVPSVLSGGLAGGARCCPPPPLSNAASGRCTFWYGFIYDK